MKTNLRLLKNYRKRMAWLVAAIISVLLMSGVLIAGLIMGSSTEVQEEQSLQSKLERVVRIVQIQDLVSPGNLNEFDKITESTIADSVIYRGDKKIIDNMVGGLPDIIVPEKDTIVYNNFRYQKSTFNKNGISRTVIVRTPSRLDNSWILWLVIEVIVAA